MRKINENRKELKYKGEGTRNMQRGIHKASSKFKGGRAHGGLGEGQHTNGKERRMQMEEQCLRVSVSWEGGRHPEPNRGAAWGQITAKETDNEAQILLMLWWGERCPVSQSTSHTRLLHSPWRRWREQSGFKIYFIEIEHRTD